MVMVLELELIVLRLFVMRLRRSCVICVGLVDSCVGNEGSLRWIEMFLLCVVFNRGVIFCIVFLRMRFCFCDCVLLV